MPFDSNGTFNRLHNWKSDAAAKIKVRADRHDEEDDNFASGLSQVITKDGKTQPTANLPLNQKKIVNLGEPSEPSDAATKNYVDNIKAFATGLSITGANFPNGMIYFAATTGTTGLSFANSDMCWASKPEETGKWRGRIAAIQGYQGSGAEMLTIDRGGFLGLNSGTVTHNLSYDGTNWRTNVAGIGSILTMIDGALALQDNDVLTVQANQIATFKTRFSVTGQYLTFDNSGTTRGGSALLQLKKKDGTNNYISGIEGLVKDQLRWRTYMGAGDVESGSWAGNSYVIYTWDNAGANPKAMFGLTRSDNHAQFWGDVYSTTGTFRGNSGVGILSAQSGPVILRPFGADNATYQAYAATDGYFHISSHFSIDQNTTYGAYLGVGMMGKNGMYGGWMGSWHNFIYSSGYIYCLINNTNVGAIQMVSDYRTKRNIRPLYSMWDKVKSLHPIRYQFQPLDGVVEHDEPDDEERWGFVAHELQEKLTHHAASFDKDVHNALQSPNLMVIVAALTRALQEAQERIEALEAKLA